tara:strand:+ start:1739 stop:2095 length:357 start_codon:yes stop_codon:yes gene_type:complete
MQKKTPFPSWLPLITIPLIFIVSRNINNNRNLPIQIEIPKQRTPSNGPITAKQAVEIYKQNPEWAIAECQNLRRLNNTGQSVNGDFWLSKSIENYRMTSTQLQLLNGWLTGNHCPDVF